MNIRDAAHALARASRRANASEKAVLWADGQASIVDRATESRGKVGGGWEHPLVEARWPITAELAEQWLRDALAEREEMRM